MHNPFKDFSELDPQPNMQFRQIENSIYRALIAAALSGPEYQLVHFVIDKTWGFQKKEDIIPLSQFEEGTRLDKRNIGRYLHRLEQKRLILINRSGAGRGKGNTYMFNKYWDTWTVWDKATAEQLVSELHLLASNGVGETPFIEPEKEAEEIVSGEHLLASNSVPETPLGNSVGETPFSEGKGVKSAGNSVSPTPGNSVSPTLSKERGKKLSKETPSLKKGGEHPEPPATYGAITEASQYLFEKTGRKRWSNLVQKELFESTEAEVGFQIMKSAIDWALVKGIKDIQSMVTTAKKKAREKEKSSAEKKERGEGYGTGREQPGRGPEAHQRVTGEGDRRFSGFRAIESGPDEPDGGDED